MAARCAPKGAWTLSLMVVVAALLASASAAHTQPRAAALGNRRLMQDKCDQCQSCQCDDNCDCITQDGGNKCDQCQSCQCDVNCDCISSPEEGQSPVPVVDKCAQCESCQCDVNCDCISSPEEVQSPVPVVDKCAQCETCQCDDECNCKDSTPAETSTDLRLSSGSVALGRGFDPTHMVGAAYQRCDDKACSEEPVVIDTEVWQYGPTPGSTYNSMCDPGGCGYFTGGKCSVRFEGATGSWDVRDALLNLLLAAAPAAQTTPFPVQRECTWWFPVQCDIRDQPDHPAAMPAFMRAQRWVMVDGQKAEAGSISMTVSCEADPRGEDTNWGCVAASIGSAVAGTIEPVTGAVLGVIGVVCDAFSG